MKAVGVTTLVTLVSFVLCAAIVNAVPLADKILPTLKTGKRDSALQLNALSAKQRQDAFHPLSDIVHAGDLTLRLPQLKTSELNAPALLKKHHEAVIKIADSNYMTEQEKSKLRRMLLEHMVDYKRNMARVSKYNKIKGTFSQNQRKVEELKLSTEARGIHHKFYQIKMFAIRGGNPNKPYELLREMLKGPSFNKEQQTELEAEIRQHEKTRSDFYKIHDLRTTDLKKKMKNKVMPMKVYKNQQNALKRTITKHQERDSMKLKQLEAKIKKLHGNEL